jgi:predicted GNAT family N-acyltransferase
MSEYLVREVPFGSPEYRECLKLRAAILRHPLGLNLTAEDTDGEAEQRHWAAMVSGKICGCLIVHRHGAGEMKMRQVAVDTKLQRGGVGKALVHAPEKCALDSDAKLMVLHARLTAVPFYERLGYARDGKPFIEVTVPHYRMQKVLP